MIDIQRALYSRLVVPVTANQRAIYSRQVPVTANLRGGAMPLAQEMSAGWPQGNGENMATKLGENQQQAKTHKWLNNLEK